MAMHPLKMPTLLNKGINMIERTLLLDMLIKYINENGIKKTMELVLEAINNSKGEL